MNHNHPLFTGNHPILIFLLLSFFMTETQANPGHPVPFSTNETHLTIWNGRDYEPFFVKGVNMGVAVPGKFPGELEVTREQYGRWFDLVKEAGFNTIRLYTLHYPHFYEVLDSFNLANPKNPLFFFQGVWLEEEAEGYTNDLYQLTDLFLNEIEENVDCVHGNRVIEHRFGKAYGTYATDVSKWNMGYIIGREIYGEEVVHTNTINSGNHSFQGNHFSIENTLPSEVWAVSALDHLVGYEYESYGVFRPVSFSSWPTLDPLTHPEEPYEWEDAGAIDLSTINLVNAPAGIFISYHIYPYYPGFINLSPEYQEYQDEMGTNTYLGYVTELKEHYPEFPLIVAEYGVPSSWGVAKYAISGMHHGGFNEQEQGENNIRLLQSIEAANGGGGIQFSLLDEWFKRTWIDYVDFLPGRRAFWYNPTSPEQNYGLLRFEKQTPWETWQAFCDDCPIEGIEVKHDYGFFHLGLLLDEPFVDTEGIWISLDTYDHELGESILPNGDTVSNRAEFALHITNHSAQLYVTQAYDIFGFFRPASQNPQQHYHSTVTDGAPWNLVRWQISALSPYDIFPIGDLQLNYTIFPPNSHDAVTIDTDRIDIRIPWALLQFVDPGQLQVLHDFKSTPEIEHMTTEGIAVSVFYKDQQFTPDERYTWEPWNSVSDMEEVVKDSYYVMKNRMHEFNNRAIALNDTFLLEPFGDHESFFIDNEGLLSNDFDLDGNLMETLLLETPAHGNIQLMDDGRFVYTPYEQENNIITDTFSYVVFDGYSLSEPAQVTLFFETEVNIAEAEPLPENKENIFTIYPNPSKTFTFVESNGKPIDQVSVFDFTGQLISTKNTRSNRHKVNVEHLSPGIYYLKIRSNETEHVKVMQVL